MNQILVKVSDPLPGMTERYNELRRLMQEAAAWSEGLIVYTEMNPCLIFYYKSAATVGAATLYLLKLPEQDTLVDDGFINVMREKIVEWPLASQQSFCDSMKKSVAARKVNEGFSLEIAEQMADTGFYVQPEDWLYAYSVAADKSGLVPHSRRIFWDASTNQVWTDNGWKSLSDITYEPLRNPVHFESPHRVVEFMRMHEGRYKAQMIRAICVPGQPPVLI